MVVSSIFRTWVGGPSGLSGHRAVEPGNDLGRFALGSLEVFLGMDGLEHQRHLAQLAGRHVAEDVAVARVLALIMPSGTV
jgi:hypothetical protein